MAGFKDVKKDDIVTEHHIVKKHFSYAAKDANLSFSIDLGDIPAAKRLRSILKRATDQVDEEISYVENGGSPPSA